MISKEILAKGVSGAILILGALGIATEPEWTEHIVAGVFVIAGILEAVRTWYKSKYQKEVEVEAAKVARKQEILEKEVRMVARVEAGNKSTKRGI